MQIFERSAVLIAAATLAAFGLAASHPRSARAQAYSYTSFDYPSGGINTSARGLNNSGQIVGSYGRVDAGGNYATFGFAVNVGSLTPAGFTSYNFSATSTQMDAVNAAGQIVGDYTGSDSNNPGFLLNGQNHSDILPGGYFSVVPAGINTSGVLSGTAADTSGVSHGFVRTGAGVFTTFDDSKADAFGTFGTGNNDAGTVVGYYTNSAGGNTSFTFRNGTFTDLAIPSAVTAMAYDIDNAGDIVGLYKTLDTLNPSRGFLLTGAGTLITLNVPGAVSTEIFGVNDSRQVVGDWTDGAGGVHGFFASPTPEPSAWVSLGLGTFCVSVLALTARRRAASSRETCRAECPPWIDTGGGFGVSALSPAMGRLRGRGFPARRRMSQERSAPLLGDACLKTSLTCLTLLLLPWLGPNTVQATPSQFNAPDKQPQFGGPAPMSAEPPDIDVWPGLAPGETTADVGRVTDDHTGGVTRLTDVTRPRLHLYPAPGTGPHPAVMVCPGGGYSILAADLEGSEAARWLNGLGFTAAVLDYRVPDRRSPAFQDAQRGLSLLRARAKELGLAPDRIGVLGFSAGGHLAARLAATASGDARPDFAVLVYPAYLIDKVTGLPAPEVRPHAGMPPMFLTQTRDDPYLDAPAYAAALQAAGVPAQAAIYDTGGHGYGLRLPATQPAHAWPAEAASWLRRWATPAK